MGPSLEVSPSSFCNSTQCRKSPGEHGLATEQGCTSMGQDATRYRKPGSAWRGLGWAYPFPPGAPRACDALLRTIAISRPPLPPGQLGVVVLEPLLHPPCLLLFLFHTSLALLGFLPRSNQPGAHKIQGHLTYRPPRCESNPEAPWVNLGPVKAWHDFLPRSRPMTRQE